ncbi:MAG: glutamate dehydrogenase, partial [Gammaproteobacteria bacterium]|nr:glutamate dehydrogenase [Gammaproteobacteria bacterium]
ISWSHDEVEARLRDIMKRIHAQCVAHGRGDSGHIDYVRGANIAGFLKVADAMLAYGAV